MLEAFTLQAEMNAVALYLRQRKRHRWLASSSRTTGGFSMDVQFIDAGTPRWKCRRQVSLLGVWLPFCCGKCMPFCPRSVYCCVSGVLGWSSGHSQYSRGLAGSDRQIWKKVEHVLYILGALDGKSVVVKKPPSANWWHRFYCRLFIVRKTSSCPASLLLTTGVLQYMMGITSAGTRETERFHPSSSGSFRHRLGFFQGPLRMAKRIWSLSEDAQLMAMGSRTFRMVADGLPKISKPSRIKHSAPKFKNF